MNTYQKKSLIILLLNNDISIIKKYATTVSNFNDEEIENLFIGEREFKYKSINSKERNFQKLLLKFYNMRLFLECWFTDVSKQKYLIQLWKKNQSFSSLKDLNENQRKEKLPFITEWPSEILQEFNDIIDSYDEEDKLLIELKNYLESEGKDIQEVLKQVKSSSEEIKRTNTNERTKEIYEQNTKNVYYQIMKGMVIPAALGLGYFAGQKEVAKRLSRKGFEKIFEYLTSTGKSTFEGIKSLTKKFLKSPFVAYVHAGLSLVNLGWSIYEFVYTVKEFNKIGDYEKELKTIKDLFNSHCNFNISTIDDIKTVSKKIIEVKSQIEADFNKLKELISKIEASIEFFKNQQKKAGISTAISVLGVASGIVGAVLTGGASVAIYAASTVMNGVSTGFNIADIVTAEVGIGKLKKLLNEANKERDEMQKLIDGLVYTAQKLDSEYKETQFNF